MNQSSGSRWLPVAATVLFGGAVAAATFAATRYAYQQELERRYGAADGSRHRYAIFSIQKRASCPLCSAGCMQSKPTTCILQSMSRTCLCGLKHLSIGLTASA